MESRPSGIGGFRLAVWAEGSRDESTRDLELGLQFWLRAF